MEHRTAELADLGRILDIVREAKLFLKECGLSQWQTEEYPTEGHFIEDIKRGWCHAFVDGREIVGVISVCFAPEADYRNIEEGRWLSKGEAYAVIHRMAMATRYRNKGISAGMLSYAEIISKTQGCSNIRVDTHAGNKAMRGLLEKQGYAYCGIIYLEGIRSPEMHRVCYEKTL